MIIDNIEIANAVKTIAAECTKHTRCTSCPLYDTEEGDCMLQWFTWVDPDNIHVRQHDDNRYSITFS